MNKWTIKQMKEWKMNEWNKKLKWTNTQMNKWTNERLNKWTIKQMKEWTNERMKYKWK